MSLLSATVASPVPEWIHLAPGFSLTGHDCPALSLRSMDTDRYPHTKAQRIYVHFLRRIRIRWQIHVSIQSVLEQAVMSRCHR